MSAVDESNWTTAVRDRAVDAFPPTELLPDRQPAYVASWAYVFGMLSLVSLLVVIATGCVLAVEGPSWWHNSGTGHFVNSMHLWSVELFFVFMVLHLWAKFFMAAWRGHRQMTWMSGAIAFVVSIGAAFTGYLSQQNFSSQWISSEAKDGLNAAGVGSYFNVLNFGQMFTWHVVLLPLCITLLVVGHVLMVRRRGVVEPFDDDTVATVATVASTETHVDPKPASAVAE